MTYKTTRRTVLQGMVAGALPALVTTRPGFAQTKPFQGVTLNVASIKWDFMETLLGRQAKEVADEMGINLQVAWYTYDGHRNKIVQDTMAGATTWDILYVDGKQVPEFASIQALEPLDPLMTKYGSRDYEFSDFTLASVDNVTVDGKVYSIPIMADPNGLLYRKDILENADEKAAFKSKFGYELKVPETYNQFMDVAGFFTRKSGEKLAGEVLATDFYGTTSANKAGAFVWNKYISYMVAFGGQVFDPNTMVPTWNSPANIACGKYYVALSKFMPPGATNFTSGESMAEFDKGRVAMIIDFYSRGLYAGDPKKSSIAGKIGYALLPSENADFPHATIIFTNSLGIYAKSKQKEAAFRFLEQITSKRVAKEWALFQPDQFFNNGNAEFPRKSIMNDPQVVERFPPLALVGKTLSKQGVYTFDNFRLMEFPDIVDIGASSISEALAGKPVEVAFNDAQQKLLALFKRSNLIR